MGLKSRAALWTVLSVVTVLVAVFAAGSFRHGGDQPAQSAPQASDRTK